jgi:hypothetical protein
MSDITPTIFDFRKTWRTLSTKHFDIPSALKETKRE